MSTTWPARAAGGSSTFTERRLAPPRRAWIRRAARPACSAPTKRRDGTAASAGPSPLSCSTGLAGCWVRTLVRRVGPSRTHRFDRLPRRGRGSSAICFGCRRHRNPWPLRGTSDTATGRRTGRGQARLPSRCTTLMSATSSCRWRAFRGVIPGAPVPMVIAAERTAIVAYYAPLKVNWGTARPKDIPEEEEVVQFGGVRALMFGAPNDRHCMGTHSRVAGWMRTAPTASNSPLGCVGWGA
jgi:hypothetical protein